MLRLTALSCQRGSENHTVNFYLLIIFDTNLSLS